MDGAIHSLQGFKTWGKRKGIRGKHRVEIWVMLAILLFFHTKMLFFYSDVKDTNSGNQGHLGAIHENPHKNTQVILKENIKNSFGAFLKASKVLCSDPQK